MRLNHIPVIISTTIFYHKKSLAHPEMWPRNQNKRSELLLPLCTSKKNHMHGESVRTKKSIVNATKVGDQYPNLILKRTSKVKHRKQEGYLGIGRENTWNLWKQGLVKNEAKISMQRIVIWPHLKMNMISNPIKLITIVTFNCCTDTSLNWQETESMN